MGFNFREAAIEETTLSHLMNGRTKMIADDVIRAYPDGFTVMEFDSVASKKGVYYICTIQEDAGVFLNCGMVMNKIFNRFVAAFEGDITGASQALSEAGGFRVKWEKSMTRDGNNITTVTVL